MNIVVAVCLNVPRVITHVHRHRTAKLPAVVKHPRKGTNESAKESSHEAKITMNWTFAVYICSQEIHSFSLK